MSTEYARRTYLLDGRLARIACPPCRTGHPCRPCQFVMLRVEASALRLDHAAAEDAARKSVAW